MGKYEVSSTIDSGSKEILDLQGVETFMGKQRLELKKIESRTSNATNEIYYVLHFDMCVKFDSQNIRNNRFIMVPLYCKSDVFLKTFKGLKTSQCIGQKFDIEVEFTPNIRATANGIKFCTFNAEIKAIGWVNAKPEPMENIALDNVPF